MRTPARQASYRIVVAIRVVTGSPIPGTSQYELAKWFVNDSSAPQWWDYSSTTEAWVEFQEQGSFHLETHIEELLFFGAWLWIDNDGDNPITFVVHFHVPTPGSLALLSIAAPLAFARRRR